MTATDIIALLRGEAAGFGTALTWVPPGVLRALTWESGIEDDADALEAVATAFELDLAFVGARTLRAAATTEALAHVGVTPGWLVDGVLTRVAEQRGWTEVLRQSAGDPGALAAGVDESLHDCLTDVRAATAAGARVVLIADELAGAAGWLVAPDFALEVLVPCYRRCAAECPHDSAVAFHSDGDIRALMSGLRSAGFHGVHFGSPGRASLDSLVEAAHAADLVPIGGIETSALRTRGATAAGRYVAHLAGSGPLVAADDGGLTSAEEIAAFGAALSQAQRILDEDDAN